MTNFKSINRTILPHQICKSYRMIDIVELFNEVLGEKMAEYDLPPPSFKIMKCEIVSFDADEKSLVVKIPVLKDFANQYGIMQGGMIMGAIDNSLGALSMLIAPKNVTRTMESKLFKPIIMDVGYIYIKSILKEHKKRRLIFDVQVKDIDENLYAKATFTNWII